MGSERDDAQDQNDSPAEASVEPPAEGSESGAEGASQGEPSPGSEGQAAAADASSEAEPGGEPEASEGAEQAPAAEAEGSEAKAGAVDAAKGKGKRDRSTLIWVVVVLVVFVGELYIYGRRGDLEVCVAKQGVHDFSLRGQERTDKNRWKFPYCEKRVNLGLRSHFDELAEGALSRACRRATLMTFKKETNDCIRREKKWQTRVYTKQIYPVDRRFYRRLFWLDR